MPDEWRVQVREHYEKQRGLLHLVNAEQPAAVVFADVCVVVVLCKGSILVLQRRNAACCSSDEPFGTEALSTGKATIRYRPYTCKHDLHQLIDSW